MNYELLQLVKNNMEGRMQVYNILRHIFLSAPSLDLLQALIDHSNIELNQEDFQFPEEKRFYDYLHSLTTDDIVLLQKELTWEYNRLFVGPYHLPTPPYESVYRSVDGLMMQDTTIEVRKKYLAAGLQVMELNRNPDDHIGLELEYMYFQCDKGLGAIEKSQVSELRECILQQLDFLENHLLQWAPTLCQDISVQTRQPFFKHAGNFMTGYLKIDSNILQEILSLLDNS